MTMSEDERARLTVQVEEQYRAYIRGYVETAWAQLSNNKPLDIRHLVVWSFPLLFIVPKDESNPVETVVSFVKSQDDLTKLVEVMYEDHYRNGWAGVNTIDNLEIDVISPKLAFLTAGGRRLRKDNSVVNPWAASYFLRETDGKWLQFAVVDTKSPRPNTAEWRSWVDGILG